MPITKKENLIIPEVLAGVINEQLTREMKFAPLATVDTTLCGQPGDKVKLPKYAYIGDAADVAEGEEIPVVALTQTAAEVAVKKAAKGVEITDEAAISGYGDPVSEGGRQISVAIANKMDSDCKTALDGITAAMTVGDGTGVISAGLIADGLVKFGENVDGEKVLLIAPTQLATLRKDPSFLPASDVAAQVAMQGTVGQIHGCQIVISSKILPVSGKYNNYIVKPGAIAVFLKKDINVEAQRDIRKKTTITTADKHYAVYLYDDSKAVKLVTKA